ncbi:MAG TPA: tetratricopeptide repeat protein [Thermodesulfovibrionia bacterium]|nr:tetratricopeptide repeat protein [Thermodesulfovibrionia bacterium]
MMNKDADFNANINKIVTFFECTQQSGFLFAVCNNNEQVRRINEQILIKTKSSGLTLTELYIPYEEAENFLYVLRQTAKAFPNGIIMINVDELILLTNGEFAENLNLSRESLIDINVPFLFWLSEKNMSLIANKATDLFIRRDFGVVVFPEVEGISSIKRLEGFFIQDEGGRRKYKDLNLKIEILEKQLNEAIKKGFRAQRIADEIAIELIDLYLDAYLKDEAFALFEKYKTFFEQSNKLKNIDLTAKLYKDKFELDKALEYCLKSENISLEIGDKAGLGTTYNNIGFIYNNKGQWDKALEYYLKSEKISLEVGNKSGLGTTYNNIGRIYSNKGQWDRALEYYLKAEKIGIEVGDKALLVYIYFNIGTLLQKKKKKRKGRDYLIRAGYIARTLGMEHELSRMRWVIDPIIEEIGMERFMEIGRKMYEERLGK